MSKADKMNAASQPWYVDEQFIRANQIARSGRTHTPLIDISLATWWRWVKSGHAPQPLRVSRGTTLWRLREVIAFIEGQDFK